MAPRKGPPSLLVIGAGVVGMSTAVRLQAAIPGCDVTVMADKFTPETTSDGAAGIFRPTAEKTPGVPMHIVREWLQDSYDHLSALATSGEASSSGVSFISGCQFLTKRTEFQEPLLAEFVEGFRELTQKELASQPGEHAFGWAWKTVICENRIYLPFLTKKFMSHGGTLKSRKLRSLQEIEGDYDVIINCAGFGNTTLMNDKKMVPIRGHLLKVEAPWIKNFIHHPVGRSQFECYVVPGRNYVTVGGTRMVGDSDLSIREDDAKVIWENALRLMPALKGARIIEQWVGLRPHREPVRLERENLTSRSGKSLKVVHNYGHGAEGVSLAWGTAGNAVRLVQETLGLPPTVFTSSKL